MEYQLLGRSLLRRNRLHAEEQALARSSGFLVIEDIGAVGSGAGGIRREADLGAGPEQLGQTAIAIGNRRVGPDQNTGNSTASLGRVAQRLEHHVISTGPGGKRVGSGSGREAVSAGPGPGAPGRIEDD